jgi:hypothetical protein
MKDITANFHRGADTSVEAHATTPEASRQALRDLVLGLVEASGPFGLTCDEAEARTGLSHQAVSPRFTELQALKLIHYGKERRKTRMGKAARVYFGGPSTEVYMQKDLFGESK